MTTGTRPFTEQPARSTNAISGSTLPRESAQTSTGDFGRRLPRERLAGLDDRELATELTALAKRLSAGTYELLVLVGEVDARGTWALWGALSCAAWLAEVGEVEMVTAHNQVRVARAVAHSPGARSGHGPWRGVLCQGPRPGPLPRRRQRSRTRRTGRTHPGSPTGSSDRRTIAAPRRPRGDRRTPTPGPIGVMADRAGRHRRHHRTSDSPERRQGVRGARSAGHASRRSPGRVIVPTACRRLRGLCHRGWRRGRLRGRRPRTRRRQHPRGRHPTGRSCRHGNVARSVRLVAHDRCRTTTDRRQSQTPIPHPAATARHRRTTPRMRPPRLSRPRVPPMRPRPPLHRRRAHHHRQPPTICAGPTTEPKNEHGLPERRARPTAPPDQPDQIAVSRGRNR